MSMFVGGLRTQRQLAAAAKSKRKVKALDQIEWNKAHEVAPVKFLHLMSQWAKKHGCSRAEFVGVALDKLPEYLAERVQNELEQLQAARSSIEVAVGNENYYPVIVPERGDRWLHKEGAPVAHRVHWAWTAGRRELWDDSMRDELDEHLAPAGSQAHLQQKAQQDSLNLSFTSGLDASILDLNGTGEGAEEPFPQDDESWTGDAEPQAPQAEQLYRAFIRILTQVCGAEDQLEEIRQQMSAWRRGTDSLAETVFKVQKLVDLGCLAQFCDSLATVIDWTGYLGGWAGPNTLEQSAAVTVKNCMNTAEVEALESLTLTLRTQGNSHLRPKTWSQLSDWTRAHHEKLRAVARRCRVGDPAKQVASLTMSGIHPQRKRVFDQLEAEERQADPKHPKQGEEQREDGGQWRHHLEQKVASLGKESLTRELHQTIAALQREVQLGWKDKQEEKQKAVEEREQWRINSRFDSQREHGREAAQTKEPGQAHPRQTATPQGEGARGGSRDTAQEERAELHQTIAALQRQAQSSWKDRQEEKQKAVQAREQWRVNSQHERQRQGAARQTYRGGKGRQPWKGQRAENVNRGKTTECRNFKAGKCRYGRNCRFKHAPNSATRAGPTGSQGHVKEGETESRKKDSANSS
jgi:hypothetical protein